MDVNDMPKGEGRKLAELRIADMDPALVAKLKDKGLFPFSLTDPLGNGDPFEGYLKSDIGDIWGSAANTSKTPQSGMNAAVFINEKELDK